MLKSAVIIIGIFIASLDYPSRCNCCFSGFMVAMISGARTMNYNSASNSATNDEWKYIVFRGTVLPKIITIKIDILKERRQLENLRANRGRIPCYTSDSSWLPI